MERTYAYLVPVDICNVLRILFMKEGDEFVLPHLLSGEEGDIASLRKSVLEIFPHGGQGNLDFIFENPFGKDPFSHVKQEMKHKEGCVRPSDARVYYALLRTVPQLVKKNGITRVVDVLPDSGRARWFDFRDVIGLPNVGIMSRHILDLYGEQYQKLYGVDPLVRLERERHLKLGEKLKE